MSDGTNWKFLIIEDKEVFARELLEALPGFVDAPDSAEAEVFDTFKKAIKRMMETRFDVLILDLKDDSDIGLEADSNPAGLEIFETLKRTRFVPVVFYTALAHKVRSQQTSFVRVVEKTEGIGRVKEEVRRVLATKLPALTRQVEELQRSYMWDFVNVHWKEFDTAHEQADLAYLLARRLALSLQKEARRMAGQIVGKSVPLADPNNIHPMEMYVPPPISPKRQAGDILKGTVAGESGHWIILTPSCDFEQEGRLNNVLLAQCVPLNAEPEYVSWTQNTAKNAGSLRAMIGDNRQDTQSERFKFLPGTYFFPDSVVDFQKLKAITPAEILKLEVVASLDSPFAEAVLARFSRYFGRLGTPDIDKNVVLNRLEAARVRNIPSKGSVPLTPPPKH